MLDIYQHFSTHDMIWGTNQLNTKHIPWSWHLSNTAGQHFPLKKMPFFQRWLIAWETEPRRNIILDQMNSKLGGPIRKEGDFRPTHHNKGNINFTWSASHTHTPLISQLFPSAATQHSKAPLNKKKHSKIPDSMRPHPLNPPHHNHDQSSSW